MMNREVEISRPRYRKKGYYLLVSKVQPRDRCFYLNQRVRYLLELIDELMNTRFVVKKSLKLTEPGSYWNSEEKFA